MNAPVGTGLIQIGLDIDADGRAASVMIQSTRPAELAPRLFAGRNDEEIFALAGQLFTLCGFSHQIAARCAIAAARGAETTSTQCDVIGLAAEHLSESLRATALGWASDVTAIATPLREAMSASRVLANQCRRQAPLAELAPAVDQLSNAAKAFGVVAEGRPAPKRGSFLAALLDDAQRQTFLRTKAPDALSSSDDFAVAQALAKGGARFAALPALPGRRIETGAFARHWREAQTDAGSGLAARLAARIVAMQSALSSMQEALTGLWRDDAGEWMAAGALGAGEGFAAVETARGRLYHWARLDADGRVGEYAVVAPTEWNFHPAGPFAEALLGARISSGAAARRRIGQLAAVFDPCVAFEIDLREVAHA
ncbi:nickel-dependent hydrogenase large subunit [Methylocystis echinoides]|uniref:nickel-dependent hydrogenase large subunit n=1 Tax=Methylocystis echinoides TaxID=29468 RepID=UPI0034302184